MVKVSDSTVTITRGDTLLLDVSIKNNAGGYYHPVGNDKVRFALKTSYRDAEPILLKDIPINTMKLRLESSDTKQLDQPAKYVYDLELTMDDGTEEGFVTTFLSGDLITTEEVE